MGKEYLTDISYSLDKNNKIFTKNRKKPKKPKETQPIRDNSNLR